MQKIELHSIEDCLELITGIKNHNLNFEIKSDDKTIIYSIARQVFKGTALTDRQYNLMKDKLLGYKDQFDSNNIDNLETVLEKTRIPLRQIDRSQYIKIVDHPENVGYQSDNKDKFVKIRFPFKKSYIVKINKINDVEDYYHKKGSHEHFFCYNEINVFNLMSEFENCNFEIDEDIKINYRKICEIKNQPEKFSPGVFDQELKNVPYTIYIG